MVPIGIVYSIIYMSKYSFRDNSEQGIHIKKIGRICLRVPKSNSCVFKRSVHKFCIYYIQQIYKRKEIRMDKLFIHMHT